MKWGTPSPISTERYREQTAASAPMRLHRKRCACGKVVTAKQLAQQGGCNACTREAATEKKAA